SAVIRAPGPGRVMLSLRVEPAHQPVDVGMVAVELPDLGGNEWHLCRHTGEDSVPARYILAVQPVAVAVEAGHELILWVHRPVLEPAVELRPIADAVQNDDIRRASAADGVHQLLHARGCERDAHTGAAIA